MLSPLLYIGEVSINLPSNKAVVLFCFSTKEAFDSKSKRQSFKKCCQNLMYILTLTVAVVAHFAYCIITVERVNQNECHFL